jgi:hypothetical protein
VKALRVLLLVLAACAVCAAVILGRGRERGGNPGVRYVCPMHAQVTSPKPGTCPICQMDLERVEPSGAGPLAGAVKPSSYQTYDIARRRAYGPDMPAPAWVEDDGAVAAILYTDELVARAPDERAVFSSSATPGSVVAVTATTEAPQPWDRSTRRVRFHADGASPALRPRDVGWLRRAQRSPEPPVIPVAAILEGAGGPYVLVVSADGQMLTRRAVEIGRVFGGVAAVLSGLGPSERVLTGSAFFVDAERRLRQETTIEVSP